MCCFVMLLGFLGPRLAFLWLWLVNSAQVSAAFGGNFWFPLLGVILLPWTTLAWTLCYAPVLGVTGIGWVVVVIGVLLDLGTYSSRGAQRYQQGRVEPV